MFLHETKLNMGEAANSRNSLQVPNIICVPCDSRKEGCLILFRTNEVNFSLRSKSKLFSEDQNPTKGTSVHHSHLVSLILFYQN